MRSEKEIKNNSKYRYLHLQPHFVLHRENIKRNGVKAPSELRAAAQTKCWDDLCGVCTVSQVSTKRANEDLPQAAKVENVSNEQDSGWEMIKF